MKQIIVVSFANTDVDENGQSYEYYGIDVPDEATHVVTYRGVNLSTRINVKDFGIARILNRKPITEQIFDGNLKPIVAAFSMSDFKAETEKANRLTALGKIITKRVEEISKLKALETMAGNDPEAVKLIEEYKNLLK